LDFHLHWRTHFSDTSDKSGNKFNMTCGMLSNAPCGTPQPNPIHGDPVTRDQGTPGSQWN